MITDIDSFLRYFDAVHRRAVRDIAALPPEAERWRPESGQGENAWAIGEIVRHMAGTRMYFARAYRGEGWITGRPPPTSTEKTPPRPPPARAAMSTGFRC